MNPKFNPIFQTPLDQHTKEEVNKRNQNGYIGNLKKDFRDQTRSDIAWESEQLAKSHGIYLEFNRALTGKEKDWMYMIRISNPGGGPINKDQWAVLDQLSEQYMKDPIGECSLRLTTRQNIQFHWVKKQHLVDIVKTVAESGLHSLNGCGDNTRNVMACPCARGSDIFDSHAWAHKAGAYFELPAKPFIEIFEIDPNFIREPNQKFQYGPQLLNRKFKIAFSAIHRDPDTGKLVPDNCVELRTNDIGIAPLIENGSFQNRFQIYVGGGQGERNGKLSAALLGEALGIVPEEHLLETLDKIVHVHQEWGDRANRHWARVKYVVKKMGIQWYREKVEEKISFQIEDPIQGYDYGARQLHFGWSKQAQNHLWSYGTFIENGRITDKPPNGRLKSMVREMIQKYSSDIIVTPNQDILFTNIPEKSKSEFEHDLKTYGYGSRNGKPYSQLRLRSGACVGRDTCRLTYTDSEKFEPGLIDQLEQMGWGDLKEAIGIVGCERQCFRPSTKTIGIVGTGLNRYQFRLMGTEDAKHQGGPIIDSDGKMYLRSVPREKVAIVLDVLFRFFRENKKGDEDLGYFHRRVGLSAIIKHLQNQNSLSDLMTKTTKPDLIS